MTCAVASGLTACETGTPSGPTNVPSAGAGLPSAVAPVASGGAAPTAGAAGQQAVAAAWTAFFDAKTPVNQRIALLQDGSQFTAVVQGQVGSSMASAASAKVTKVTLTSPTQAAVTYSILLDGEPALPDQIGTAVFEDGGWKVGVGSFCNLLLLENGGSSKGLPSVCQASATPSASPS